MFKLEIIKYHFSICKLADYSQVDFGQEFCFTANTDEEKSLVCITDNIPGNTASRDDGWRAFRIQGELDFSLIGILSKISAVLADNKIGIFAVSTYNTDYIFVKDESFEKAINALTEKGYEFI